MNIPTNFSPDLHLAVEATRAAGQVVAGARRAIISAEEKGDKGLVTAFDKQAEQVIFEILRANSPYSILGEESGLDGRGSELVWVVDPIDGTTNFARGLPLFAISIALMRGIDRLLGVILNPTSNDCYFAERGRGAYVNGEAMHVSANQNPRQAVIHVSSGYAANDRQRLVELMRRLDGTYSARILGTTALELCLVASGVTDAFVCSGDELWDYAAGVLLVEEAGGIFTDWRGQPWNGQHAFVFASNGQLHRPILEQIQDLQPLT